MTGNIAILSSLKPVFPDPGSADLSGMLAIGGNLNSATLTDAYSKGIFPWYEEGSPILWYSPDPRLILYPYKLKVTKSLKISLKKYEVKYNTCFRKVIENCADMYRGMQDGTWITKDMKDAYIKLHKSGIAHSFETFYNGKLVGGLYGVVTGRIFVGESMFHLMPDASKAALYYLCETIKFSGFDFIDCQTETAHLISMGAELISRKDYLQMLKASINKEVIKIKWNF